MRETPKVYKPNFFEPWTQMELIDTSVYVQLRDLHITHNSGKVNVVW